MQTVSLGTSSLHSSRLAYGCWRVAGSWNPAEVTPASEAAWGVAHGAKRKGRRRGDRTWVTLE